MSEIHLVGKTRYMRILQRLALNSDLQNSDSRQSATLPWGLLFARKLHNPIYCTVPFIVAALIETTQKDICFGTSDW